jgi:SAM-dependent methyltransferase
MDNYLFIDKSQNIREGLIAKEFLESKNDLQYFSSGKGVFRVSYSRWKEAQDAECNQWLVNGITANDDRNIIHLKKFDNYSSISGLHFKNAIELGCGPFTNISLILNFLSVKEISLLDPLINEYLNHPNVCYDKNSLLVRQPEPDSSINYQINRILKKIPFLKKSYGKRHPVKNLFCTSIEDLDTKESFDLIVLINVLEHCYNAESVFAKISSLLNHEGILIFHDKYYKDQNVEETLPIYYDAAHPLKVEGRIIEDYLNNNFQTIYKLTELQDQTWHNIHEKRDLVYFIGRKIN